MPELNASVSVVPNMGKAQAALDAAEPKTATRPPSPPYRKLATPAPKPAAAEPKAAEPDVWDFDNEDDTVIDPKAATPKPVEQPAPPKTYQHTPRLLAAARRFGISPHEASLTPPDDLIREVNAASIEAREAELDRQRAVAQQPTPKAAEDDEVDWGEIDSVDPETGVRTRRKATEEDINPGIAKNVKAALKANKELNAQVKQLAERDQQREQQRQFDVLDTAFTKLADGYGKHLGDLPGGEMTQGDPLHTAQMKRRIAVLGIAQVDFTKDSPRTIERKIKSAVEDLYGAPTAAEPEPEVVAAAAKKTKQQEREEEWAQAGSAVPTARNPPAREGKKAAMEEIKNWKQKTRDRGGDDIPSGLPDDLPD